MSYRLTLTSPVADLTADQDMRTLTGLVLPFGEIGRTSAGPVTAGPGSVTIPPAHLLRRVKLFDRHDEGRTEPTAVGFAAAASETPAGVVATFAIARTPAGDAALLDAAEGTRDAFSVELDDLELTGSHIASSTLRAVAQIPVPAFASARLVASDTPPNESEPAVSTDTPIPDPEPVELDDDELDEPAPVAPPATLNAARTRPRRSSLSAASAAVSRALVGVSDAGTANARLNAALADITPAASGTDALMRPQWIGELWSPHADNRPMANLFGAGTLTSMTWEGWRWVTEPVVGNYDGNKAPIPTSPASIEPATGSAYRIAGGWDLDRIYVDFPTGFLEAFWQAAVRSYRVKSESELAEAVAAATAAVPAADVNEAIGIVVNNLLGAGASVDAIFLASDAWASLLALSDADIPWWVKQGGSVSIKGGTAGLSDLTVAHNPALEPGTVLGADSEAVDYRETGPIRVEAVNIPNGGIDLALFGYAGQIIQNTAGIARAQVTAAPPLADPTAKRK